jgi:hypothetical protein
VIDIVFPALSALLLDGNADAISKCRKFFALSALMLCTSAQLDTGDQQPDTEFREPNPWGILRFEDECLVDQMSRDSIGEKILCCSGHE